MYKNKLKHNNESIFKSICLQNMLKCEKFFKNVVISNVMCKISEYYINYYF